MRHAIVLLAVAAAGLLALRFARGSWLGRAVVAGAAVFVLGYGLMWALGDLDCRDAGTCSGVTDVVRPAVIAGLVAVLLLAPVLALLAVAGRIGSGLPDRPRFGKRDGGWIATGVGALLLAPLVILGASETRGAAAVMMLTVAAMALAPPLASRFDRDEDEPVHDGEIVVGGVPRRGLLFRFSRGRQAGLGVVGLGFAVLGVIIAAGLLESSGSVPLFHRIVGIACVVMGLVFGPLNFVEARRGQLVALLDDGLAQRTWAGTIFVPWDALSDAWLYAIRDAEMIGLSFSAPDRVVMPPAMRVLGRIGRRTSGGADHSISVVTLRGDPEELFDAIAKRT